MKNKQAIRTWHSNQNRLAMCKAAAVGSRKVAAGLTYAEPGGATRVTYCGACHGPVVDDALGRRRHGLKSEACKAAMGGASP